MQESPVKGIILGFYPLFFANLGHLERYIPPPPVCHVFLEALIEKKTFRFSKRALRVSCKH